MKKENEITYSDIISSGNPIYMYQYAVAKATPEERESIFKKLVNRGLIRWDNPSHDGMPFYMVPVLLDVVSKDASEMWLNQNGELVLECPFVIDEKGNVRARKNLQK